MDRARWERILTRFQARARGFLLRTELRNAQKDFEEVVINVEGSLNHLTWLEAVIRFPHFTQTCPSQPPDISAIPPSEEGREQMKAEKDVSVIRPTGERHRNVKESISWGSSYSDQHYDPQHAHWVPGEPQTPEDLWLHRNTLTMELLWIQQAIDSRKKYLSLKDKLSVS